MTPDIVNPTAEYHQTPLTGSMNLAEITEQNAARPANSAFDYNPTQVVKMATKDPKVSNQDTLTIPEKLEETGPKPENVTNLDQLLRTNKDALKGYRWAAVLDILQTEELPKQ